MSKFNKKALVIFLILFIACLLVLYFLNYDRRTDEVADNLPISASVICEDMEFVLTSAQSIYSLDQIYDKNPLQVEYSLTYVGEHEQVVLDNEICNVNLYDEKNQLIGIMHVDDLIYREITYNKNQCVKELWNPPTEWVDGELREVEYAAGNYTLVLNVAFSYLDEDKNNAIEIRLPIQIA